MSDESPVVNRVLLRNGGMFDTIMTLDEYQTWNSKQTEYLPGVFGERLFIKREDIIGFIDRTELDIERATAAMQAQRRIQLQS